MVIISKLNVFNCLSLTSDDQLILLFIQIQLVNQFIQVRQVKRIVFFNCIEYNLKKIKRALKYGGNSKFMLKGNTYDANQSYVKIHHHTFKVMSFAYL